MKLQNAILEVRTKQGLKQEEFAEKLNVTRQAVSRWETGETTPTIDTLKKITELFKVDICEMLGTTCQSCSWPLNEPDVLGTNADESVNMNYCGHCHPKGEFSPEQNIAEMVDTLIAGLEYFNEAKGTKYTEQEAREFFTNHLATLPRWKK